MDSKPSHQRDTVIEDGLGQVFDFTPQDRQQNMWGQLSERQRITYRNDGLRVSLGCLLMVVVALVVFIVGLLMIQADPTADSTYTTIWIAFTIIVCAALGYFFGFALYRNGIRKLMIAFKPTIETVEGTITLVSKSVYRGATLVTYHHLEIGSLKFPLQPHEIAALHDAQPYRIYYETRTQQILSLQQIRQT